VDVLLERSVTDICKVNSVFGTPLFNILLRFVICISLMYAVFHNYDYRTILRCQYFCRRKCFSGQSTLACLSTCFDKSISSTKCLLPNASFQSVYMPTYIRFYFHKFSIVH
jgi:hypothetical protein